MEDELMNEMETAISFFRENVQLTDPKKDPVSWNLNDGLLCLSQAIEQELGTRNREIASLARQVADLTDQIQRLSRSR